MAVWLKAVVAMLVTACAATEELPAEAWSELPPDVAAAETLLVDSAGRAWVGLAGGLARVRAADSAAVLPLGGSSAARVLALAGDRAFVASGDDALLISADSLAVLERREGTRTDALLWERQTGHLLQGTASGAVMAHDAETLRPVWAWAALGNPVSAMAASPFGDRVYMAVEAPTGTGGGQLLTRDLQTGRILDRSAVSQPLDALVAAGHQRLYGLTRGSAGAVIALSPGSRMEVVWQRGLREMGLAWPASLGVSADGQWLAVAAGESGMRLLDADGNVRGGVERPVRDAAFGPDGSLYLLTGGRVDRIPASALPLRRPTRGGS